MSSHQLLDWDTEFFGFPVAKITESRLSKDELEAILKTLKEEGVRLVYWPSDSEDSASMEAGLARDGFLADRKVFYLTELGAADFMGLELLMVEEYQEKEASQELKNLALISGVHSRYNLDPHIPHHKFEELYLARLENSISGELAKKVFILRSEKKLAGMATLEVKNETRGQIGLLAVDVLFRGRGMGKVLVKAARAWFAKEGYRELRIVTQQQNLPACRLYENCGFRQEKVENFFHFWL